ncbi:MAG: hypothetical protein JJ896_08195 [Rhodothermales bacterium]|nr:hypothetical protein [Rhodothermales bacterium]MBO6779622.1 hypothetical protein [Rhodothermales bacterium]
MTRLAVAVLLPLAVLQACDGAGASVEVCAPLETDLHVPMAVGDVWQFEVESSLGGEGGSSYTRGSGSWEVQSLECREDKYTAVVWQEESGFEFGSNIQDSLRYSRSTAVNITVQREELGLTFQVALDGVRMESGLVPHERSRTEVVTGRRGCSIYEYSFDRGSGLTEGRITVVPFLHGCGRGEKVYRRITES